MNCQLKHRTRLPSILSLYNLAAFPLRKLGVRLDIEFYSYFFLLKQTIFLPNGNFTFVFGSVYKLQQSSNMLDENVCFGT